MNPDPIHSIGALHMDHLSAQPEELIGKIIESLEDLKDVARVYAVSRQLCRVGKPVLYTRRYKEQFDEAVRLFDDDKFDESVAEAKKNLATVGTSRTRHIATADGHT
jgi:hypothetical protein